jgi:hypothetical protein
MLIGRSHEWRKLEGVFVRSAACLGMMNAHIKINRSVHRIFFMAMRPFSQLKQALKTQEMLLGMTWYVR